MTAVVAGLGNPVRRDDGVGSFVAAQAALDGVTRDVGPVQDPLDLLGRWDGATVAIVIDAMRSGSAPGSVRTIDLDDAGPGIAAGPDRASTHTVDLVQAWRLARALGTAPGRVVVVGIEGQDFGWGRGLSPAVRAAVPIAVRRVAALIREGLPCA